MGLRKRVGRRLSDDQEAFLAGGDILSFVTLEATFGTLEAAREAWFLHRERLTAEYGRPGSRLWGWWEFEATEGERAEQLARQDRQQRELRTQPEARDPVDNLIPLTRRLAFPLHDGNGADHPKS